MKKRTSVIALILLVSLLFTGCDSMLYDAFAPAANHFLSGDDILPTTKNYSQYGFTFRIVGNAILVSNEDACALGTFEFKTLYGTLYIIKMSKSEADSYEKSISELEFSKELLDNGARLYEKEIDYGTVIDPIRMATEYFIDAGEHVWRVYFDTPIGRYKADEIYEVCRSFRLVDPS